MSGKPFAVSPRPPSTIDEMHRTRLIDGVGRSGAVWIYEADPDGIFRLVGHRSPRLRYRVSQGLVKWWQAVRHMPTHSANRPRYQSSIDRQLVAMAITEEMIAKKKVRVLNRINGVRAIYHVPPVEFDEALSSVAQAHATDMSGRWFYSSVSPEGKNSRDRLTEAGLTVQHYGDALAAGGLYYAVYVVRALIGGRGNWNPSPITDETFTRVGLGRAPYWIDEPRNSIWCALLTT